jgi:hypothetical protein|tara:strand:- start:1496 stop:1783 length:288 start_codon:yes stop_codon:yes gene_type:complete
MLNVGFSEVGDVSVVTSSHSGLSVDHWADRATDKIISVGSNSDPILVEQAKAYRETIKQVIMHYMKEAILSNKTDLIAKLEAIDHKEIGDLLRRL